jgi:hypothetical protein
METKNQNAASFAAQVAKDATAQAHAQEIANTRKGGLGGSDAALVLRIAERGLAGLTATDIRRLCVMIGTAEQVQFETPHTNAGHAFEEYAEQVLPLGETYEREKYITKPLADQFKTFAHADFVADMKDENGYQYAVVIECKYVQKPTAKVIETYFAQLQWYYMLGAQKVVLYHGTGAVDPFCVEEAQLVQVERDEKTVEMLLQGIKILNDALREGWTPQVPDKMNVADAAELVQKAFVEMQSVKAEEAALKARKDKAAATLKEWCEAFSLTGLYNVGEEKHQLIYTRATVGKTFDSAKFLAEHPEYKDAPEYWKETSRAASVTFK